MILVINTCYALYNLCIDNSASIAMNAEEEAEICVYLESDTNGRAELSVHSLSVDQFSTARSFNARLRHFKEQRIIKRNEVMNSFVCLSNLYPDESSSRSIVLQERFGKTN
ncbi:hypothetical protein PHYBLDRAFT_170270 [Phycomyces blakesleeanus NRRL 1555(-)]|uniref:Uncharacterized protein n=1 Tax=Phycomyces blakesleeanus (strain ATCC 8743b / DSM 1359 / FGSC 10004 / NBRC 33097 / NRRL 1555) TaxID=763407 RepID=A0A163DJ74_PHYB8|nr:hypothetical protein PHYBLDRAFT_170270 [Phycomyces blakesleeanus NRRL 1555(-)]OAD71610.1 hypothetical protein PHYBLDRAFT_170270 [Phycomyces blakesleeanus NRRL 1555(-)]|eukprot:XP_018289650.1 hypothetical protein PHYBLDRAFT_170270 [Phycomyces blakesleeanus NRRL 1555(-)]